MVGAIVLTAPVEGILDMIETGIAFDVDEASRTFACLSCSRLNSSPDADMFSAAARIVAYSSRACP
jgi:hypothetical protein